MKIIYILIFTYIVFITNSFSQVSLSIGNGLQAETNGLSVDLSGDLEENDTGYLKGIVTSGNRGNDVLLEFAGLTISSGAVDKITRITGTSLSNTAPKTSLRRYEVENTTAVASDISSDFKISLEDNGIVDPFLYSNVGTLWTGYLDNNSSADIIGASSFYIPSGTSNIVVSEGVGVAAKIYLEGPYTSNAMSTNLSGSVPLTSPYSEDPRTVTEIPTNAVDWVLIELRNSTTPSSIESARSVFLKNDGTLIDDFGGTSIGMPNSPDNYYIGIKHRNHLGVMSKTAQPIDWLTP